MSAVNRALEAYWNDIEERVVELCYALEIFEGRCGREMEDVRFTSGIEGPECGDEEWVGGEGVVEDRGLQGKWQIWEGMKGRLHFRVFGTKLPRSLGDLFLLSTSCSGKRGLSSFITRGAAPIHASVQIPLTEQKLSLG